MIKSVELSKPDQYGLVDVKVNMMVTNFGDEACETLRVHAYIFGIEESIIDEIIVNKDFRLKTGSCSEVTVVFKAIPCKLLDSKGSSQKVVVELIGSKLVRLPLGNYQLPENSNEVKTIDKIPKNEYVALVSGSVWKSEEDEQHGHFVITKFFLNNLSPTYFFNVRLDAAIEEKWQAGGENNAMPNELFTLSGHAYVKKWDLNKAFINMELIVPVPVFTS